MKKCTILVVSFVLLSCQSLDFPQWPEEFNDYYVVDLVEKPLSQDKAFTKFVVNPDKMPEFYVYDYEIVFSCLKFEIVSRHPFKIKFLNVTNHLDCRGVGGFQPEDSVSFFNFIDDLFEWAKHEASKPHP